jgi:hypothetical protein
MCIVKSLPGRKLMKNTRRVDLLFGSGRVRRGNSANHERDESLFSRLLRIESRLRAGADYDLQARAQQRNFLKMKVPKRSKFSYFTRYIE